MVDLNRNTSGKKEYGKNSKKQAIFSFSLLLLGHSRFRKKNTIRPIKTITGIFLYIDFYFNLKKKL